MTVVLRDGERVPERPSYKPLVVRSDGRSQLAKRGDACVFLEENLCSIHAEKPASCREFPFFLRQTPGGTFVGLTFACTAVSRGLGRSASAHRDELASRQPDVLEAPFPVTPDRSISWAEYLELEAELLHRLDQEWPPLALHAQLMKEACRDTCPVGFREQALMGLLAVSESVAPEALGSTLEALSSGGRMVSRTLGGNTVEVDRVNDLFSRSFPGWLDEELARFLRHAVFRKDLLAGNFVLARLCALAAASEAALWYTAAAASLCDRPRVCQEDWWVAVEAVERSILSHARGLDPYFDRLALGLARQGSPQGP